jgi:hypothetical protein
LSGGVATVKKKDFFFYGLKKKGFFFNGRRSDRTISIYNPITKVKSNAIVDLTKSNMSYSIKQVRGKEDTNLSTS